MKRLKFSIFFKLIIIIIAFLTVLDLSVLLILRESSDGPPSKKPRPYSMYMRKMEKSLVNEIGYPPDTVKARDLADELDLNLRFQSHSFNWTSSETVPTIEDLTSSEEFKERFPFSEHFVMRFNDRRYAIVKDPRGIYILQPFMPQDYFDIEMTIFLLIIDISVLIILLYLILRWQFKPLKNLSFAVREIGSGNYDVSIPVDRKDELGELSRLINEMSSGIRRSIRSKEQLLIDVSHELRTPLTRIKLGLEVGSDKEKINDDVREMERMISGLLESYRSESNHDKLNLERTDVFKAVNEVMDEYRETGRLMLKSQEKAAVFLNIDLEKFKAVLRNVIDNAIKYSNESVEIDTKDSTGQVQIFIKDKGTGIPDEDLKYIFEPFYRADPSRSRKTGGFGLGLAICKRIMDAHGGSIEIKSKVSEGTEVILTLKK
jgi:signal transduction histidine kinase